MICVGIGFGIMLVGLLLARVIFEDVAEPPEPASEPWYVARHSTVVRRAVCGAVGRSVRRHRKAARSMWASRRGVVWPMDIDRYAGEIGVITA